jgi:polygalacturonase
MRALICLVCSTVSFIAEARQAASLPGKIIRVAAGGNAEYSSIQRAIDAAPPEEGVVISIAPGTYREVLEITKPKVQVRDLDPDPRKTVIVFDKSSGTAGGT